jgi:predicted metal-dependent hydrolase
VRPDGGLRVTIPRGGSRAEAVQFVERQAAWIARQRARVRTEHRSREWADGTTILLAGAPVVIRLEQDGPTRFASYADRRVSLPPDVSDVRPFIERDLRVLAQATLAGRVHELARRHSLTVARVTIRDQRSRWGSCSKEGRVALNFRLIQMPSDVCDYVIVHELMHLRQQNHSIRFWRLVERACPAFRDAERWLRTEGRWLL